MKITILDGFAENPGDLSWEWLAEYGDYTVYDRTPAELIAERVEGCDIIITNKTPLRRDLLETLGSLKYIGLLSTGFNIVDWDYCKEKGIPVCNILSYSTAAVAQLTFALILEHTNAVAIHSKSVHDGEWAACKDFCYWKTPLTELQNKTLGIIGFGSIGKAVAKIALAFGMKVIASTNHPAPFDGVEFTDKDTLLKNSDFVSLHTPLNDKTEGMVNAEFLSKMSPPQCLSTPQEVRLLTKTTLPPPLKAVQLLLQGLMFFRPSRQRAIIRFSGFQIATSPPTLHGQAMKQGSGSWKSAKKISRRLQKENRLILFINLLTSRGCFDKMKKTAKKKQ